MSLILNIETATGICSVAIGENDDLLICKESVEEKNHSSYITILIGEVLKEAQLFLRDVDAIAISKGPGSYTGLRIGVSVAKGLCYALEKPLIAVSTLQAMAWGIAPSQRKEMPTRSNSLFQTADQRLLEKLKEEVIANPEGDVSIIKEFLDKIEDIPERGISPPLWGGAGGGAVLFCPMIDARRMEVYTALFDSGNNPVCPITAEIIDKTSFKEVLEKNTVVFFGDGAEKCRKVLSQNANAIFLEDMTPSAKNMITLANKAFRKKQFEDVAYFEPFYLKDFIAGVSRKKVF